MVKQEYHIEFGAQKNVARAMVKNAPISLKYSTELCRELSGMHFAKAENYLQRILAHETYIPLRRYNRNVGHKKGKPFSYVKSGRFADTTVEKFVQLLQSVKANADNKGLDSDNLIIQHMFASQGFRRMSHQSQGRISGKMHRRKSTHVEIVVREGK